MGEMQDQLKRLLGGQGDLTSGAIAFPRVADVLGSELASSLEAVYRRLGGVLDTVPVNFRKWDLESGVALKLDEYLHFNRYSSGTRSRYSGCLTMKLLTYGQKGSMRSPSVLVASRAAATS